MTMAIFSGNWLDPEGVPFDVQAKVPDTWVGGGSAAVRRHGTRPHPSHAPFARAAQLAARRWHQLIPSGDQDAWTTQGLVGASERSTLDRTPVPGYIMYNAFDFVQLYHAPPSYVVETAAVSENFLTAVINEADFLTQTVTFTVTADALLHIRPNARLATYQVNPRKAHGANPWRATRLIDFAYPAAFDPPTYQTTVPLMWQAAPGDTVRLYFRGRVLSWWKFEADDTIIVT